MTRFLEPFMFDDLDYFEVDGMDIDDLQREIDIARFYRTLLNIAGSHFGKSFELRLNCRAVQTLPVISSMSESWIILVQRLLTELFAFLTKMVNGLYHTPNGYSTTDGVKGMPKNTLKYFSFENGYWQSKLLPEVKIPVDDRQVNPDKKTVDGLLEIATKLQNCADYLMDAVQGKCPDVADGGTQRNETKSFCRNENKGTAVMEPSGSGSSSIQFDVGLSTNLSVKSETDSAASTSNTRSLAETNETKSFCRNENEGTVMMEPSGSGSSSIQFDVGLSTNLSVKSETDSAASTSNERSLAEISEGWIFENKAGRINLKVIPNKKCVKPYDSRPTKGVDVFRYNVPRQASRRKESAVLKRHPRISSKKPLQQAADMAERIRKDNNLMNIKRSELMVAGGKTTTSERLTKGNCENILNNVLTACTSNLTKSGYTCIKVGTSTSLNADQRSERTSVRDKTGCSSMPSKNFIKRNIFASKFPVHRGATVSKLVINGALHQ